MLLKLYAYVRQVLLARNYGLFAQLNCMNYRHLCKKRVESRNGKESSPQWVLADLDRTEIQDLQKSQGEKQIGGDSWRGLVEEVGM